MITEKVSEEKALAAFEKASDESLTIIKGHGFELDMAEWLTIARYSKKYAIPQSTITSWIARGVIPGDAVQDLPELNNIRLIKDQPYR
ncbi:hypothetical protein ACS5NO_24510 [Larkinella sp. GY13]|uniref:hypothetical protein n=1 Tax=Larkinella sp. GY13 TaxID=3453720 RepID=UPI003EED98F8